MQFVSRLAQKRRALGLPALLPASATAVYLCEIAFRLPNRRCHPVPEACRPSRCHPCGCFGAAVLVGLQIFKVLATLSYNKACCHAYVYSQKHAHSPKGQPCPALPADWEQPQPVLGRAGQKCCPVCVRQQSSRLQLAG